MKLVMSSLFVMLSMHSAVGNVQKLPPFPPRFLIPTDVCLILGNHSNLLQC